MRINPTIELSIKLALFLYPVVLLTVEGGMGWLFFLLFLISVYLLINNKPSFQRMDYWFVFAMTSTLVATILSQASHANFLLEFWDSPSRFLFSIPIYLALRNMNKRVIASFEVGLPLGAITGLVMTTAIQYIHYGVLGSRVTNYLMNPIHNGVLGSRLSSYLMNPIDYGGRISNYFMNPIHFGNLALLLGVLSLCSINWMRQDNRYWLALKISGMLAGVSASVLSGTRGGWVAIPFMLLAWVCFQPQINKTRLILRSLGITVVLVIASYMLVDTVQQRFDQSVVEVVSILHGDMNTSLGFRIRLWQAATIMFTEHPLFGVGPDAFFQTATQLQQQGRLSSVATETTYGQEVHSYYFAVIAELGSFGLLATCITFIVPLVLFFRVSGLSQKYNRVAASMGACTVIGFIVCCFTVEMFNLKMIASFYALTVAVLMAAAYHQQAGQQAVTSER
jgi:O-antigen ligase